MRTTDETLRQRKAAAFGERLEQLAGGADGLRAEVEVKATPDPDDEDIIRIVASDETVDRYHEVIQADGWELDNYRKNPVIQNSHKYDSVIHTLGRALETRVIGGALRQVWQFASKANPIAKIARDLYRGGFLKAASVGFDPKEWEDLSVPQSASNEPRRRYLRQELLEVSAVSIPANPNALSLALKSGAVDRSDLREAADLLREVVRSFPGGAAFIKSTETKLQLVKSREFVGSLPAYVTRARIEELQRLIQGWEKLAGH